MTVGELLEQLRLACEQVTTAQAAMDIHWTLEVHVPQLDTLTQALITVGGTLVETIDTIRNEMIRIQEGQARAAEALVSSSQALTEQVTRIADEVEQFNASGTPVTDEQMNTLGAAMRSAADLAAQQAAAIEQMAADIRTNSDSIGGIVPDAPPPTP